MITVTIYPENGNKTEARALTHEILHVSYVDIDVPHLGYEIHTAVNQNGSCADPQVVLKEEIHRLCQTHEEKWITLLITPNGLYKLLRCLEELNLTTQQLRFIISASAIGRCNKSVIPPHVLKEFSSNMETIIKRSFQGYSIIRGERLDPSDDEYDIEEIGRPLAPGYWRSNANVCSESYGSISDAVKTLRRQITQLEEILTGAPSETTTERIAQLSHLISMNNDVILESLLLQIDDETIPVQDNSFIDIEDVEYADFDRRHIDTVDTTFDLYDSVFPEDDEG